MNRLILCLPLLLGSLAYGQSGSPFTLLVHDTTGNLGDTPLPAFYQLSSTAVGASTPLVLKMTNTSSNTVYFGTALVSTSPSSTSPNANFSVTGVFLDQVLAPNTSVMFNVNFAPTATGVITGYLNLAYQVQQNGCVFSGVGTVCPSVLFNVSTLSGTATNPVLTLSYQTASGPVTLTPSSASPLNYPSTSLSSTSTITFTLSNSSNVSVAVPSISLAVLNSTQPGAFALDTSAVPSSIPAQGSANFNVTFAPSQVGLASGTLQIGSNSYPIQGYGIIVATIDSLQISYTNATGVRTLPQAATPIPFGQVIPGSGASAVLSFSLANPATSSNAVSISAITIAGATFSITGLPTMPVSIAPGSSISFNAAFTPIAVGTFTGSLAIGTRTFSLTGTAISSTIPSLSITTSGTVTSQQQMSLVIQLSAPSPVTTLGTLTMSFTPSVANVTDDAAVIFTATKGRQLNIAVASGAQTATYNNQSSITFQTGTTGGTLTFAVAFPNTPTYTQPFSIPLATPVFSLQANREAPNLLVTLGGYDNTYSAGVVSFTFYDTSGNVIGSPISFDATSNFKNLFFTGNTYGGLFSLQASFPVQTGDITKVASVTASLANASGTTTQSASFQ